jgi:hypothetical protein
MSYASDLWMNLLLQDKNTTAIGDVSISSRAKFGSCVGEGTKIYSNI